MMMIAPWRRLAISRGRTTTNMTKSRFQNPLLLAPLILLVSHYHGGSVSRAMTTPATPTTAATVRGVASCCSSRVIHLNHAGASIMPPAVLDCMSEYQQLEQTVGGYAAAEQCQEQLQQVYQDAATLIHATNKPELEIALVESATVAWTRLFYSFCAAQQQQQQERNEDGAAKKTKNKKIILVSEAEYAANLVAACHWAKTHKSVDGDGWSVLAIPSVTLTNDDDDDEPGKETAGTTTKRISTGKVDLDVLETMLSGKYTYQKEQKEHVTLDPTSIALVCITHIPTNSGIINPVYEIGNMIAKFNNDHQHARSGGDGDHHDDGLKLPSILYLVDACQSVGQIPVNVQQMQCHGIVATGRKYLRGPRGTGFMYIPASIVNSNSIWPHHVDHHSVPIRAVPDSKHVVVAGPAVPVESFLDFAPRPGATRFEFYESNIGNKLGLGVALQHALKKSEDDEKMSRHQQTHSVAMYLYDKLKELVHRNRGYPGVRLYYKPECGIVTFWIHGLDSVEAKRLLSQPVAGNAGGSNDDNGESLFSFEVSVVPATSTPLDSARTGVPDLLRASVSYSSTRDEVDLFCDRLECIIRHEHGDKR